MEQLLGLLDAFWDQLRSGAFPRGSDWNYLILLVLVIVEGPLASLLGAVAASAGIMDLRLVFLTVVAGNFLADVSWYLLGYMSKERTLLRYGRWLGLRRRHLQQLRTGMRRHAVKILLVAKFSTGFIIPTLVVAGLVRVPFRQWFPVVFAGELFWATLLLLIGYYATETVKGVERGLHYLAVVGFIAVVALVLYLARRTLRPRQVLALDDENGALDIFSESISKEHENHATLNGSFEPGEPASTPHSPIEK